MDRRVKDTGTLEFSATHAPQIQTPRDLLRLSLGALGVVYGDIGTSPLYTVKECLVGQHGVSPTTSNVLGVLSLIVWSLIVVVVVKYVVFVLQADNRGDGGIMALLALVTEQWNRSAANSRPRKREYVVVALGLVGASLLLSDGMITPAISVLGALEGLDVATPVLRPLILPLALGILAGLFLLQKRGTEGVGQLFGPAIFIWFVTIGSLGIFSVLTTPEVFYALDPRKAMMFFLENGWRGFFLLGSVVLAVTGAEALYADLGHFGRTPIRVTWFSLVFPALALNYLGQGALLLRQRAGGVENPFFEMAPQWFLLPLVLIATVAAIIASQAMISGAFSLAQQAVQLGFLPRLTIVHTSERLRGQIYVPEVNGLLMVACMALVLEFREASALAAAYGIAVVGTMITTSCLFFILVWRRWQWPLYRAGLLLMLFLAVELSFLVANIPKIASGGWFPLAAGSLIFTVMLTWRKGRGILKEELERVSLPVESFIQEIAVRKPHRVPGIAVFLTSTPGRVPPLLLHHFKHNKVLHDKVILFTVVTEGVPWVPKKESLHVKSLGEGFYELVAAVGFMQTPRVPQLLRRAAEYGLQVQPEAVSYFLGRETLLTTGKSKMAKWQKRLFAVLARNARPAHSFFGLPSNRVIEIGAQVEL